jgi:hypothetical protein
MTRRHAWAVTALALAFGAGLAAVGSGDIQVQPVVADGHVAASFAAPACFTDDARAVLRSGLVLTFTFTVELRRPSPIWFDHTLAAATVGSSAKYDNLTGNYQVSKLEDNRVVWSERTQDDGQVRDWMTTFDRVPLTAAETLQPAGDYYVRVRLQATPKRNFSLWPFGGDDASGRAAVKVGA